MEFESQLVFLSGVRSSSLHCSQKMAMILDAFIEACIDKLVEVAKEEISMLLGVENELKKLQRRMERIAGYLESAEQKRYTDRNINTWVMLKDIAYDAEDIVERCKIEGRKLLEDRPPKSAVRHYGISLFSYFSCLKFRHIIGNEIRTLNDRWNEIEKDRSNVLSTLEYTRQGDQVRGVNNRQTFSMEIL
uniref:Uncharacterized protein LOC114914691 n=1 Tax=Elaeis guineensis var. tenera TaxID=51953 RepID=A0A8N4IBN4_ELAGV|nr:uncharacterized protein LOC114914691 [Elaeis guineensis]